MLYGTITKLDSLHGLAHLQPDGSDEAVAIALSELGAAAKERGRFAFELVEDELGKTHVAHAKALMPSYYVGRSTCYSQRLQSGSQICF